MCVVWLIQGTQAASAGPQVSYLTEQGNTSTCILSGLYRGPRRHLLALKSAWYQDAVAFTISQLDADQPWQRYCWLALWPLALGTSYLWALRRRPAAIYPLVTWFSSVVFIHYGETCFSPASTDC